MKKIIRLTESDLHNLVQDSIKRVLREQFLLDGRNDALILQEVAQNITQEKEIFASVGRNDFEAYLRDDRMVHITYKVLCDPYIKQGMKSNSYDVPDDEDEIMDEWDVEIIDICLYDYDDNEVTIEDNGIVRDALKRVIQIDYGNYDIPTEKDYFSEY